MPTIGTGRDPNNMPRHRLVVLLLCALLGSSAFAGPKEDAIAVLDQWTKAFAASDVDAIVKLYAPETYFMGTGSKSVVTDHAAIRKYFEDAILTRRPRSAPITESHVVVLSDEAVLITGSNSSNGVLDGKPSWPRLDDCPFSPIGNAEIGTDPHSNGCPLLARSDRRARQATGPARLHASGILKSSLSI